MTYALGAIDEDLHRDRRLVSYQQRDIALRRELTDGIRDRGDDADDDQSLDASEACALFGKQLLERARDIGRASANRRRGALGRGDVALSDHAQREVGIAHIEHYDHG